jgi:hypothetical protein
MLDYSSAVTPLPSRWIGPAPEVPGYKGLFGLTEMTNVRVFGSQKRVPLDVASRFTTFSAEEEIVELLRSRGYSTWPEFEMIVGGDGSNIVLDKMHLRNVVLKHMHVVYGGDVTVLENVTFIDCTFDFVRTERAIELGDLIIKREAVTLGP